MLRMELSRRGFLLKVCKTREKSRRLRQDKYLLEFQAVILVVPVFSRRRNIFRFPRTRKNAHKTQ